MFVLIAIPSLLRHFLVFSRQEDLKCSSSFLRPGPSYREVVFRGK